MGGAVAAAPPTYEEHVMHYTMVDRSHHYPHYPAPPALYEEYDPDGKYPTLTYYSLDVLAKGLLATFSAF